MTNAQKIVAFCREQLGEPYVFGASGADKWDCSGLTKMAVKQIGLDWYHGATTQRERGFEEGSPARYGYWDAGGTIDTLPEDQQAFLFNQDLKKLPKIVMAHTGVYDGAGRVIQAGGYGGKGVHEGAIDKRRWSHWCTLKIRNEEAVSTEAVTYATVRLGSKGNNVAGMQQALANLGYKITIDGKFGAETEVVLKDYQTCKGLESDGVCGPLTWAAINAAVSALGESTVTDVPLTLEQRVAALELKVAALESK